MSFILQNGNFKILVRTSCEQKRLKTKNKSLYQVTVTNLNQGLFQQFWEKAPGQNWEKMIDLKSKLGEIDIEHNKGSKIYPQNQVILDCIMQSIPLHHKYLSIILIWVIVSHK